MNLLETALTEYASKCLIVSLAQQAWSAATFGDRGPQAALKHLARECREALAAWEAGDLEAYAAELADIRILLHDATWRAKLTEGDLIDATVIKLDEVSTRTYPKPDGDNPTFHQRAKRVYVSARDSDWARTVVGNLSHAGFEVVSTWHDDPNREFDPAVNFAEIDRADAFVLLASPGRVPGGKFVETGYALARDIPCVSLNPMGRAENRFTGSFPAVKTLVALVSHLEGKPCPTSDK